jgi:type IV secretion system protein VirB10
VATAGGATAAGAPTASGGDDPPLRATVIRGRSTTIAQGSLIAATLETPIDSTRAGFVRAIVARDARGFDDSRILVPRGSRLIGEYASDVQSGQRRVLVTWTRLIRPDGVAIRLGSPATDRLGQAGIPGRADTHFLARFTSAVLQTALTIGTNLAARPGNGTVIVGVPGQATGSIGQLLSPGANLRPTIKVAQGAAVMVFVARDLDFAGATPRQ